MRGGDSVALNWVEELVGQLYQVKGYLVVYDVDLPMPKTDSRSVRGHSDIDVLAIRNDEVVHVECQSWWGPDKNSEPKELRRLKDRFDVAPDVIRILRELVTLLRQKYPRPDRVGKEPSLTRFLLHLIHNGFVNETTEQTHP